MTVAEMTPSELRELVINAVNDALWLVDDPDDGLPLQAEVRERLVASLAEPGALEPSDAVYRRLGL